MDITLGIFAALANVAVIVLGVFMTLYPEWATQHRTLIIAAFVLMPVAAIGLTEWRAAISSAKIEELNKRILTEITGSPDSYIEITPFFQGDDYQKGVAVFTFYNGSGYPMIDTSVGINGTHGVRIPDYHRRLGDVLYEKGGNLPGLKVQLSKEDDNQIIFSIQSRSVILWEYLYISWNGKGWVSDFSIRKRVGRNGKEEYVRKVRDDFPFIKDSGWFWERQHEQLDAEDTAKE